MALWKSSVRSRSAPPNFAMQSLPRRSPLLRDEGWHFGYEDYDGCQSQDRKQKQVASLMAGQLFPETRIHSSRAALVDPYLLGFIRVTILTVGTSSTTSISKAVKKSPLNSLRFSLGRFSCLMFIGDED